MAGNVYIVFLCVVEVLFSITTMGSLSLSLFLFLFFFKSFL